MAPSPLPALLVDAAIRAALTSGASVNKVSAITSAAVRAALSMQGNESALVSVPADIVDRVPPIAEEMAAQHKMTRVTGQACNYGHQAYRAARKVCSPVEAKRIRKVNRVAGVAKHDFGIDVGTNLLENLAVDLEHHAGTDEALENLTGSWESIDDGIVLVGDWVYGTHGSQYKISVLNGDISFTEGSRTGTLLAAGDALEGQINNTDGTLHGYIQISSTTAFGEPCPVSRFRKSPDVDWDLPLLASRSRTPNPKSSRTPP